MFQRCSFALVVILIVVASGQSSSLGARQGTRQIRNSGAGREHGQHDADSLFRVDRLLGDARGERTIRDAHDDTPETKTARDVLWRVEKGHHRALRRQHHETHDGSFAQARRYRGDRLSSSLRKFKLTQQTLAATSIYIIANDPSSMNTGSITVNVTNP